MAIPGIICSEYATTIKIFDIAANFVFYFICHIVVGIVGYITGNSSCPIFINLFNPYINIVIVARQSSFIIVF